MIKFEKSTYEYIVRSHPLCNRKFISKAARKARDYNHFMITIYHEERRITEEHKERLRKQREEREILQCFMNVRIKGGFI